MTTTKFHYVSNTSVSLPVHSSCVLSPLVVPVTLYHSSIPLQYALRFDFSRTVLSSPN